MIVAADLVHKKAGDNPHLWYDPATMPAVAKALAAALGAADPAHAGDYTARLEDVPRLARADRTRKSPRIRGKYAGVAGDRERAGVRLHGGGARPENAQ